jgi:hypothetical protein
MELRSASLSQRKPEILPGGEVLLKGNTDQGKAESNRHVIHITLTHNEDIKLQEVQNAWKQEKMMMHSISSEEEAETEELLKKMRSAMNKISPENFGRLVTQAQDLLLHSDRHLQDINNFIFEKAAGSKR